MGELVLRAATAADTEALVTFTADVLRHQDAAEPDPLIAGWTSDLMRGQHPSFTPEDFFLVEDRETRTIVSCLCLIAQTWSYGGIPIAVGQVEMVGTRPDHRGLGLVRRLFTALHERSAARGLDLLAIDGVPWFYRQFGYEMALALRGEISIEAARVASPTPAPPYRVRPARDGDLPFIATTAEHASQRYVVTCPRSDALWRHELNGPSSGNPIRRALQVVDTASGRPVGFLVHPPRLWGSALALTQYEVSKGSSWDAITPSVLAHLRRAGETYARDPATSLQRIGLCLGTAHPCYAAVESLQPRDEGAYAWYLRVMDLPAFLRRVAPVLERRLATSPFAAFSSDLRLSFYRDGLRLSFEAGRLVDVVRWRPSLDLRGIEKGEPSHAERADGSFPDLTFLQLLFGHRSLAELQHAFADCFTRTEVARALLPVLFPKQPSNVWPVL